MCPRSIVVDALQNEFKLSENACIYLYFDHRDQESQGLKNLISCLLTQLVQLRGESFEPSKELKKAYNAFKQKGMHPTIPESVDILKAELSWYSRIYLVVDALDECLDHPLQNNREEFLRFVLDLPAHISVLLTSRTSSVIEKEVNPDGEIKIAADEGDLRGYIQSRFEGHANIKDFIQAGTRKNPEFLNTVISRIIKRSEGM